MRINQNSMAINAYRNLSTNSVNLGKSLEKLSSGFRINRAADDAAGLVISQGLRAQISGLRQATRNAQDGISVVQTAEGALNEVHNMLNRMRDLAVQAANTGSNDEAARAAAQAEITALTAEVTRIADKTQFGKMNLLNGEYGGVAARITGFDADDSYDTTADDSFDLTIEGGALVTVTLGDQSGVSGADAAADLQTRINAALAASSNIVNQSFVGKVSVTSQAVNDGSALTVSIAGLAAGDGFTLAENENTPLADLGFASLTVTDAAGEGAKFQVGANAEDTVGIAIRSVKAADLGVDALNVETYEGAEAALRALDGAISTVSEIRGDLGALQNRFESMINNLQVTTENLVASESRIRDTDMAAEMTNFTKNQILSQASTAMLAQANQVPQTVLQLLR